MIKNINIWVYIAFFLLGVESIGFAQNERNSPVDFSSIKNKMSADVQGNIKLTEENKKLRAQLINLQLEVKRQEQEVKELNPDYDKSRKFVREQREVLAEPENLDEDSLINEAQNIYLSGQSLDLPLEQEFRELRLYDLQYQVQELRLDYRELEGIAGEIGYDNNEILQDIQDRIDQNEKREEELSRYKIDLTKATMAYPQEIGLLKMEIKGLKKKIGQLRTVLSK